jgi:putative transposase
MRGVTLDFSRPGKPTDNAFIESLNGKFRTECLNTHWFLSLDEARRKCEAWRRDYNEVRPHSAIGNQVPAALHRSTGNPGQPSPMKPHFSRAPWSKVGGKFITRSDSTQIWRSFRGSGHSIYSSSACRNTGIPAPTAPQEESRKREAA